jgi:hypothetical protein
MVGAALALGIPDQTLHAHVRRLEREGHKNLKDEINKARNVTTGPGITQIRWPEKTELARMIREAPSLAALSRSLGVTPSAISNRCRSVGLDPKALRNSDRTEIKGDRATLTATELQTAEDLMLERGFNPDEWEVKAATVNTWTGADGSEHRQLKVHLDKKIDLGWLFPAQDQPARKISRPRKPSKTRPVQVALVGDHQAPYHSKGAHDAFLRFLKGASEPFDRVVHVGDLVDFPTISRHADSAVYNASAQECLNSGYLILREIVEAARKRNPDATVDLLVGNHDQRVRTELLLRAERMYGIRPADVPGADTEDDALSLRRLLRLDELGITLHDDPAGYAHNELAIADRFVLRHGWLTKNAAKRSVEIRGASIAVGHTHSKSTTFVTRYHNGQAVIDVGAELGTMSQTASGIGFAVLPNWQPGWGTVTVHDNGLVNFEHALYNETEGIALWRNRTF